MVLPSITMEAIAAAGELAKNPAILITILQNVPKAWKTVGDKLGSRVKRGAFQNCNLEMFGDKACIVVNENSGEVVLLTSDTIQSRRKVKEEKKLGGKGIHTYFYLDIIFKDGSESYAKMRRKYYEAIIRYT